jgi:UDP-glucose 4-epimerase
LINLILGGAGFIGTNLNISLAKIGQSALNVDSLLMGNNLAKTKQEFNLIEASISGAEFLEEILLTHKPDRIYHLAANSDISASSTNPSIDISNTFLTTYFLIEACRKSRIFPEIVFSSTSAVYGPSKNSIIESTSKNPVSSYGWSKLLSEEILKESQKSGVISRLLVVRFPNVTGMWQTHGVVKDLVQKLKMNHDVLNVLGDGNQNKPYVLANELTDTILNLVDVDWTGCLEVNLAPKDQISVKQIVNELINVSKLKPKLVFGETPYGWVGDIPEYSYDTSYSEQILGPLPFRSSKDAIVESVKWEWSR